MPEIPEHVRKDLIRRANMRMFEQVEGQLILPLASLVTVKPGHRARRIMGNC